MLAVGGTDVEDWELVEPLRSAFDAVAREYIEVQRVQREVSLAEAEVRYAALSGQPVTERAWCYFRNLCHAVYRAVRHAGAADDTEAKLTVDDPRYGGPLRQVASARRLLASGELRYLTEGVREVRAIEAIYRARSGLALHDARDLFRRNGWPRYYGGPPWVAIVSAALELGDALAAGDAPAAERICDRVDQLSHWSTPLVPGQRANRHWPVACSYATRDQPLGR